MSLKGVLAATLVKPGKYELREYPLPDPQPGCVLVKMEISGSVVSTSTPTRDTPANTVAAAGRGRFRFRSSKDMKMLGLSLRSETRGCADFEGVPLRVGDRVIVGPNVSCGTCYYCRHDFPYYCCESTVDYGNNISAKDAPHLFGGWSQYPYVVPGSFLVRYRRTCPRRSRC